MVNMFKAFKQVPKPSLMICDDPEGWDGMGEGGSWGRGCMYKIMADLCCCILETNTAL